jgi:hypothetical protein
VAGIVAYALLRFPEAFYYGRTLLAPNASEASVYYRNCAAARAARAAPIAVGQPGYRPELDSDSDGIACEPYR